MSHPNTTEQKPNPSVAIERNFFFDMSFPRSWPSMSTPASFTFVSSLRRFGRDSAVISSVSLGMMTGVADAGSDYEVPKLSGYPTEAAIGVAGHPMFD